MSDTPRFNPPLRVPTLTEVVQMVPGLAPTQSPGQPPAQIADEFAPGMPSVAGAAAGSFALPLRQASVPDLATDYAPPPAYPAIDELQSTQRVLIDVQRQIDLMLEYRLREALAPLLARLGDSLIRDARDELASTLRDVVARAVAQELARQRGR